MTDANGGEARKARPPRPEAVRVPPERPEGRGLLRDLRSSPVSSAAALSESIRWLLRGFRSGTPDPVASRDAAVDWLLRAQDARDGGGFARGYGLVFQGHLQTEGWQPPYPESTGYTISTLYLLAHHLDRPELADRATRAARWEAALQLPSGGVVAGVVGESDAPALFNTGQVLLGWLCAYRATGEWTFADSAWAAAEFLSERIRHDGRWSRDEAPMARRDSTLYYARAAWALAEAGVLFGEQRFRDAAARSLGAVAAAQRPNGWLPRCCLTDPDAPLLHTLAYALRGLLEGGRVLEDERMIEAAERGSAALAERVGDDGRMGGRFRSDWSEAVEWSCLTGQAQMCSVWLRLAAITGREAWSEPVSRVLDFVASTQNTSSRDPGLRGGIAGSAPIWGNYGRYEILSWATKFFVDALVRDERRRGRTDRPVPRYLERMT